MPFHRNVFFDGAFFASSRSRIPVQDAEACLFKKEVGHVVVKAMLWIRCTVPPVMGIRIDGLTDQVAFPDRPSPKQYIPLVWTRDPLHNQIVFRSSGCGKGSRLGMIPNWTG